MNRAQASATASPKRCPQRQSAEAERIRELDHVGRPVDDAIAFHVRRNAEPRPVNTYHAGTEFLAGLIVVLRLESASRAAVELEHRLALRVTILGEARAAVLQDHALFDGVADSLCHFLQLDLLYASLAARHTLNWGPDQGIHVLDNSRVYTEQSKACPLHHLLPLYRQLSHDIELVSCPAVGGHLMATMTSGLENNFDYMADDYDRIANIYSCGQIRACKTAQMRNIAPGARVLYAGVGGGEDAVMAARKGAHVTVIDLSPRMLAKASERITAAGLEGQVVYPRRHSRARPPRILRRRVRQLLFECLRRAHHA
jgi:Methyltransferase domain